MYSITIIFVIFSVSTVRAVERPLCVPLGTCLQSRAGDGTVDVRAVLPDPSGKCPMGKELCNQQTNAINCGFAYGANGTTLDGPAPYGAHPWLAYLTNQTGYTGSGVLLDRYHVLTAAHKVYRHKYSLQKLQVYIGVYNREFLQTAYKRNIEDMIIHPAFDPITLKNDLAVLRLKAHIPLGYMKNVGAACLPRFNARFVNKRCMVAGWGVTDFETGDASASYLKQVTVPIVPFNTCYQSMKNLIGDRTNLYLDKDGELCAGGEEGRDACTDDGGAPLICRDDNGKKVVAGLVIWGKKCGRPNVYGVYVDVSKYVDWITRAIRNLQA